jgi:putative zinc finger protein
MTCRYADWDGGYILGALSAGDRLEYEQHLDTCTDCARAVREVAGLPGLLAQIDASVLEPAQADLSAPETLLPALLHEVQRSRRRRSVVIAGLAAAAAVLVVAVPVALTVEHDHRVPEASDTPSASAAPTGRPMAVLGGAPVRAALALEQVAWGTRLDLTCTYVPDATQHDPPRWVTYVLVVRTRDGRTEQVGTWRAQEGKTMRLTAATAARGSDIASVQVRTTGGRPVLRFTT